MTRVDTARRKAGKAQKAAGRASKDARKKASKTADRLSPRLENAWDSASSYTSDAAEWVQPRLDSARQRLQDDLIPKITEAVAQALEASEPVRDEAKTRGTAAIAALRGDLEPPKSRKRRWGKRIVVLVSLAGAAAGAAVAWGRMSQTEPTTIEEETATLAGTTSSRAEEQDNKAPTLEELATGEKNAGNGEAGR